ncbi:unnamed protein product [Cyclocybe aegerita]|uniref:Uncharacterized protein n=1 Tax=Cyclocybe aegerita TaxID=1973307 RepID=A0A8S0X2Q8_CYCAE|nr:unnamed protein product [Cyclocybe aegerita]
MSPHIARAVGEGQQRSEVILRKRIQTDNCQLLAPFIRTTSPQMESSADPLFPQETFDLFIDAIAEIPGLARFRRTALQSCNLVSRSFSHSARRHIFNRVSIDIRSDLGAEKVLSRIEALNQLLGWVGSTSEIRSPQMRGIAPFINTFSFSIRCNMTPEIQASLASTFKLVSGSGVQGVELCGLEMNRDIAFQRGIADLIRSPCLRILSLRETSLPRLILLGAHIKTLEMVDECFMREEEENQPAYRDIIRNRQLTGDAIPSLEQITTDPRIGAGLWQLIGPILGNASQSAWRSRTTNLRCLSFLIFGSSNFKPLGAMSLCASNTMERLSIRYTSKHLSHRTVHDNNISIVFRSDNYALTLFEVPEGLDLSGLRKLRFLHLYHHRISSSIEDDISTTIKSINPPASLETLEIEVLYGSPITLKTEFRRRNQLAWEPLDSTLASPLYSMVRCIDIYMHFNADYLSGIWTLWGTKYQFAEEGTSAMRRCLPSFNVGENRKRLNIHVIFSSETGPYRMRDRGVIIPS